MKRILMFCAALILANTTVFGMDPCYVGKARTTDEGMQDDYIYTFSDGEINPRDGEPVLMVNGAFTSKAKIVIQNERSLAPIRFMAETFNAEVGWDENTQKVTITGESVIELTIDQNVAVVSGEAVALDCAPVIINDSTYVPLRFVSEQFNKSVGYLPGIGTGDGLAYNPVIWIDDRRAGDNEERLQELKASFSAGLENSRQNNIGGRFEETFNKVISTIEADIENTRYIGPVGRYAMYRGPYITLVDTDTNEMYFYIQGYGIGAVQKADLTDPELFWSDYIRG